MTDLPKLKADQNEWFKKPRMSRLASVMYPHLCDESTRKQMNDICRAEGKKPPQDPNLIPYTSWDANLKGKK
jgi:hypothetical protein